MELWNGRNRSPGYSDVTEIVYIMYILHASVWRQFADMAGLFPPKLRVISVREDRGKTGGLEEKYWAILTETI